MLALVRVSRCGDSDVTERRGDATVATMTCLEVPASGIKSVGDFLQVDSDSDVLQTTTDGVPVRIRNRSVCHRRILHIKLTFHGSNALHCR